MIGANVSVWSSYLEQGFGAPGGGSPLLEGLVSAWPLSTDGSDAHGANDLTNNNSVTFVQRGPSGVAAKFTAANSEALAFSESPDLTATFTIAVWAFVANKNRQQDYFGNKLIAASDIICYSGSGTGTVVAAVRNSAESVTSTDTLVNGWNFIVVRFTEGATLELILNNGTPKSAAATSSWASTAGSFRFGGSPSVSVAYNDDVMSSGGYWNIAVSDSELASLYNGGKGKAYSDLTTAEKVGLVNYWNMTEASGDRADSHGTNTLTDVNTVTSVNYATPANMPATAANIVGASSQHFSIAHNSSFDFAATGFTLGFWYKSVSAAAQISRDDGAANRCWVYTNSWYVFQDDSTYSQAGSLDIPDTNWHFMLMWFDPAVLRAQGSRDNGSTQQGAVITGVQDQTVPFYIGRFTTSFSTGLHGPVMLWNRVLTSDERTALYNSGDGLFYPFS